MKKLLFVPLICAAIIFFYGCKSSKEISKVEDTIETEIPFTGKAYQTDKDYFRAKQVGESPDLAASKKIALQNAKTELAANIQSLIKSFTEQYVVQRQVMQNTDFGSKFENLAQEIVKQELKDVKIIGEKLYAKKDKSYQYWIAIEVFKETILNGIEETISRDAKLSLDFDKTEFRAYFNEAMEVIE